MEYPCFMTMEMGDVESDFAYLAVDESGAVVEEPWDNGLKLAAVSKGSMYLRSRKLRGSSDLWVTEASSEDIAVNVYVTESRLIFYCREWKRYKGTGLGLLVAAGMNAVHSSRTKNMVMAGQIRYEWLRDIGFVRKQGWLSDESLDFEYLDTSDQKWSIRLNFPKGTDTQRIANNIAKKTALYRLAMTDEKDDAEIESYAGYANGREIKVVDPKEFSYVTFEMVYKAPSGIEWRPDPARLRMLGNQV